MKTDVIAVSSRGARMESALLQADIDSYGGVRAAADEAGDRGAGRICLPEE